MPQSPKLRSVGYYELLRSNSNYRRLWLGDIASLLGDWFNTIALYTLVTQLTGSPLALGLVMITKMLPFALASPLAGLLADRFNRRRLMIASDLLRALVVLAFLLVDKPSEVPLLYALTALQVVIGSVFVPARSASIPNITTPRELLTANALSAATWSTLLAVGAALGGFAAAWLGLKAVFLIDSASYLVSAAFIYRTTIPQDTKAAAEPASLGSAYRGILDGWRYLRQHPGVGRIALTKAAWSLAGGGLVFLLTLIGESWMAEAPSVGIGLLFAARGLGTGLGPVVARAWIPQRQHWPAAIGVGIAASGVAYLGIGSLPWNLLMVLLVTLAHSFSGANWVMSTVLLQERTEDQYRGRVFSTEWLLLLLGDTVAIITASLLLERGVLSLRSGVLAFATFQVAMGIAWLIIVVPRERSPTPVVSER
ncbi:MAG: MFS transporter [Deltaproteobacteria bacterium]|nr:MFS transporter [Deltaproteobacteria bacterium]